MDITSPNSLWKEYDVSALPINESALSQKNENGVMIKEYYFDGYATTDGRIRAFVRICEHPEAKGTVLYLCNTDGGEDDELINTLYSYGYTVAALDYLGKTDRYAHYTLYPKSLNNCNARGKTEFDIDVETQYSPWYIWTCIARRAVELLAQKYGGSIFALGVGLGGTTVYKLASFDSALIGCVTLLNIIPDVRGDGNKIINYHASLDNSAYATLCKIPMFMGVSSNAEDGSLDDMSALAQTTESLHTFRIAERAFIGGIKAIYPEIDRFFDDISDRKLHPSITPSNSDGNLYLNINIKAHDDGAIEEKYDVKLYVAFCIDDAPFRNWMNLPIISLGTDAYIAHINVCQQNKPIYAFANIIKENGAVHSSPLLEVMPKQLNIKAREGVSHRKIYDGSMGEDCWSSRDGGTVKKQQGPYGIDGITCSSHSIITLKPGDPLFKVSADTMLQLMISGKPQPVTITVHEKSAQYSCNVQLTNSNDWHKFSLNHINFKGKNGPLADWSNILMLEFDFADEFIIGSVIWV